MKRLVTFFLLASSLVFVGCNEVNNSIARKHLEEILESNKPSCSGLINYKGITVCDLDFIFIIEETAHGEDRVVLKQWTGSDWKYRGVDFSTEDYDAYVALPNDIARESWLLGLITAGFQKYGYLKYEAADGEFYSYKNPLPELFTVGVASIKDVELMGSRVEDQNSVTLGEKFSAQYGLSNERGQVVAKTLAAYNKLASKRSLTPVEKDQFSTDLLGVDYKTAEEGIKGGDANELEKLMEQAAKTNGTTPEAVSAILRDMVL